MRSSLVFSTFLLACATTAFAQDYSLTILHNNDGESRVVNAGSGLEDFGGLARFATLLNDTRNFYEGQGHGVLTISSGDNFLAGAEFEASRQNVASGGQYYDALALNQLRYDAVVLGNHEFDFGTQVLADFIADAQSGAHSTKFLSANLDFSADAALNAQFVQGNLAKSTMVTVATSGAGNKQVGIIGATTENLPFVSSPGAVTASDVAAAVNTEIASLKAAGADHIILASHLQGIAEDQQIAPMLDAGIDLIIAGGGDDRLATVGPTVPSPIAGAPQSVQDTGFVKFFDRNGNLVEEGSDGDYASSATDSGGNVIPIVSTDANYKYLGRITLDVTVDSGTGDTSVSVAQDSNPQRVSGLTFTPDGTSLAGGVTGDSGIQSQIVDPVKAFVDTLASTKIGETSGLIVGGGSSDLIRSGERNGGNLVADAIFAKATEIAANDADLDSPTIALVNGGGIRADIAAGDVTQLDSFNVSRFQNFVSIVEDVTIGDLKQLLENAYSKVFDDPSTPEIDPMRVGDGTGRFAHVSGMSVIFDIGAQEMVLDDNGNVVEQGQRIRNVTLDDGTVLVEDGAVVFNGTIDIATLNFLALGGDQYFDSDYLSTAYDFTNLAVTDQQSLSDYIQSFGGADIFADSRYDAIADGRIVAVPEPGSLACGLLFVLAGTMTRRRKLA